MRPTERGNALFLILIAVALFAALSYAVTQSSRGSGTIDKEQALIFASRITQTGAMMQSAALRLALSGTNIENLAVNDGADTATPCSSGADCLFAPEGGGITAPSLITNAMGCPNTPFSAGNQEFLAVSDGQSVQGIGTSAPDIFYFLECIREDICLAINKGLGISGIPGEAAIDLVLDATPGRPAACLDYAPPNGRYIYYHVLIEN